MTSGSGLGINELTDRILGACVEVHRHLGPGLLESPYVSCVFHELLERGIPCERQVRVPLVYKALEIPDAYRLDLFVARRVVLEIKAVDKLADVHAAQVITYLRLTGAPVGLLVNFRAPSLRGQIRRLVNPTHQVPRVTP
jgi:GxxExxY protein